MDLSGGGYTMSKNKPHRKFECVLRSKGRIGSKLLIWHNGGKGQDNGIFKKLNNLQNGNCHEIAATPATTYSLT